MMAGIGFTPSNRTETDNVNSPAHYKSGNIETIDIIQDKLSPEAFEGYCVGNILKYTTRYPHKNGLEDLKKASWYLDRLISFKNEVSADEFVECFYNGQST